MFAVTVVLLCVITITTGHVRNDAKVRRILKAVTDLQLEQEDINTALEILETRIDEISNTSGAKNGNEESPPKYVKDNELSVKVGESPSDPGGDCATRLEALEKNVEVIKNYLIGQKKINLVFRHESEAVLDQMKSKFVETEALVDSMKENVKFSIEEFGTIVREVNASAHSRNVNVLGVVYYGGVGSTCSRGSEECLTARSECREGKCQCLPGLSYNDVSRKCVETCDTYGKGFQTVRNCIIRGYNNALINDTSLADCKQRCFNEESFICVSIDYFNRQRLCYLSEVTQLEVPEESWECNTVGRHFQRDCN